jgi:probable blue pigment (indigoidine) exporter
MNKAIFSLLVIITTALMGSSFAVGKMGLVYSSPLLLVAFRFTLAGIIMSMVVILMRRTHPNQMGDWIRMMIVGFFQTAGVMGCIFLSLRTITAGESSILTFTNPLLVVLLGTLFLKARYHIFQWLGVIVGFVGVFITMGSHLAIQQGTLFGFSAAVSWAIATLLIKVWGKQFDIWVLTAYQMLFGGLFLLLGSFLLERSFFIPTLDSIMILLWLAIMASIVQFAIWFFLLQKGDPGKTSAFLFLAPLFGVLSGWILLGEQVKLYVYIGGVLIFIGIFLVNWTSSVKKQARLTNADSSS